jgi:hypothetical protein
MDRIEGELTELRAQCAKYLDDVETMRVARQQHERRKYGGLTQEAVASGIAGRTGVVETQYEFARLMHERVTRLEDSMFELIYELRELRLLRQR